MERNDAVRIFISYSFANIDYKNTIVALLKSMKEHVEILLDEGLLSESVNQNETGSMINEADIFLLLVSDSYLRSDFIKADLKQMLQTNKRIIPIILEPCSWQKASFAQFSVLPREGKPVSDFKNRLEAYSEISEGVQVVIKLIRDKKWMSLIEREKQMQLGVLELDNCGLTEIPQEISKMTWLTKLSLANNRIQYIDGLSELLELKQLNLSHNLISYIHGLNELVNLRHLDLSYNQITVIGNLDRLTQLSSLELHHNQLERIDNLLRNTSLKTLGLSSNKITKLENVGHLKELQSLYASHNAITDLNALGGLPKLNRIVLSNNRIQSIKPLLKKIKRNLPVSLNYSFDPEEQGLFLKDNTSLSEPSVEVIQSGKDAIIKYFSDAGKYGTEQLEIVKLILVGNSRVGKTNFSEFLRNKTITENSASTHVLDIQFWDMPDLISGNEEPVRVNIFDFGGQDYYHDSHRMYYTHDTAYVLLWDAASNQYSEEMEDSEEKIVYENYPVEYWLESINYNLGIKPDDGVDEEEKEGTHAAAVTGVAGTPTIKLPVLVIQNKIDVIEGTLDQHRLSCKYKNVWGYFSMSLTRNKRTSIVYEVLKDYMSALSLTGRTVVKFEMDIITSYFARSEKLRVITLEQFRQECVQLINDPGVEFNRDNAVIVAKTLHNTGLLFYDKPDGEESKVYTNVRELNEIVKRIMDKAKKGNDKGIFNTKEIADIPFAKDVLAMLTRNNSIIKINGEDFLVPQFLPVVPDPSIEFFLHAFTYCQMRFVYKAYFHKSLLLNLFAECLKDSKIDTSAGVKSFPFWRNGIIVSRGEGPTRELVLVKFRKTAECGIVEIRTMKPFNNKGLEKDIETKLDHFNTGWTVTKEISVNSADYFDVRELRKQIRKKQFVFYTDNGAFTINDFKDLAEFKRLPKKLFISYSSRDAAFTRRFMTHLEVLKTKGLIEPWFDRMIESGSRWDDTIRMEMKRSDIIIFLLSPDFIATEYVMKTEIPLAIEQWRKDKSKFFFIQLLDCLWQQTILHEFQQTNDSDDPDKKVIAIGRPDNDEAWSKVINELITQFNITPVV